MSRYTGTYAKLAVHPIALIYIWDALRQIGGPFGVNYISDHQQESEGKEAVRFGDICLVPDPSLSGPSVEEKVLKFAQETWGERTLESILLKLGEESGEVLGAGIKIPEGRATMGDLLNEVGDVLIVLSQICALNGTSLMAVLLSRFAFVQERGNQSPKVGCAACDRGDFQLGHSDDCPNQHQTHEGEEFTEVGTSPIAKILEGKTKKCPMCGTVNDIDADTCKECKEFILF